MSAVITIADVRSPREAVREEAVAIAAGLAFTLALFLAMARFEHFGRSEPREEIEDVHLVSLPLEPLPPLPQVVQPAEVPEVLPLAGIEAGASDSPVSIAVVPPDLEHLFPTTSELPKAKIEVNALYTDFKPKVNVDTDVHRVFQEFEVDQKPHAVVRAVPTVPPEIVHGATALRVVLLLQINQEGRAEATRVMMTSGSAKFDEIVARTVQEEWRFSPAIRHGKKVKVLAQQAFRISFSNGSSPFNLDR